MDHPYLCKPFGHPKPPNTMSSTEGVPFVEGTSETTKQSQSQPTVCGKKRRPEDDIPEPSKLLRREICDSHQKQDRTINEHCFSSATAKVVDDSKVNTVPGNLHVGSLPVSVLLHIFSSLRPFDLLHRVGLVCKSWHQLALDPSLWRTLDLKEYDQITDSVLLRIVERSKRVRILDISHLRNITSDGIIAALKCCEDLRSLKIMRSDRLSNEVYNSIAKYCQSLHGLYLNGSLPLRDENLVTIASSCCRLELLRINQCSHITDVGVVAVAKHCPNLRQIAMDQLSQVTDVSLRAIVDHCPKLQAISAMTCSFTDEGVGYLAKVQDLRFLEVSHIKALTNRSIMKVVASCPRLKSINVSLCSNINDECVDFIAKHAKCLTGIFLVSCSLTDEALKSLGSYSRTVETVDVGWCKRITDEGVVHISRTCSTLKYLGLTRCDLVTEPLIEDLLQKHPCITYSTMWLDCKRLIERARREGVLLNIPSLTPPGLPCT